MTTLLFAAVFAVMAQETTVEATPAAPEVESVEVVSEDVTPVTTDVATPVVAPTPLPLPEPVVLPFIMNTNRIEINADQAALVRTDATPRKVNLFFTVAGLETMCTKSYQREIRYRCGRRHVRRNRRGRRVVRRRGWCTRFETACLSRDLVSVNRRVRVKMKFRRSSYRNNRIPNEQYNVTVSRPWVNSTRLSISVSSNNPTRRIRTKRWFGQKIIVK